MHIFHYYNAEISSTLKNVPLILKELPAPTDRHS